jgi:hypothetical protein
MPAEKLPQLFFKTLGLWQTKAGQYSRWPAAPMRPKLPDAAAVSDHRNLTPRFRFYGFWHQIR